MEINKEEILKKLKKEYDELNYKWSIERDRIEAKSQHAAADAIKRFEEERENLRKLRREMQEKIVDLEVAGENAWYDVKEGADEAWKALSAAFEKAVSHFK